MNVLLFVSTMIMVMAMLTYARLETYRSFSLLQEHFNTYMVKNERGYINQTAKWWYDTSRATKKGNSNKTKKSEGRSRLSFLFFIDKAKKETNIQIYPQIYLLAKKLMYVLYKNQPFFIEMEQQRPDILDILLNSLMVADNLPKEQKIKKAEDLANLDLGDPVLNIFFYKMLKGTEMTQDQKPKIEPKVLSMVELEFKPQEEDKGEEDDEGGDTDIKEEYHSPENYYSLLDYITIEDSTKIRVFLAPYGILLALFDDPILVRNIMEYRQDLFTKLTNDTLKAPEASDQFKNLFLPRVDPTFNENILDFSVTKTNPKNYE